MDKNTQQMPNGVIWPCYENGAPVRFGEVIDNGIVHFPVKSIRFNEDGWVIYDSSNPANAKFADTGRYDEHATRYVEPDSWSKWRGDLRIAIGSDDDMCPYFNMIGRPCGGCPAYHAQSCVAAAIDDLHRRAIKLAKEEK